MFVTSSSHTALIFNQAFQGLYASLYILVFLKKCDGGDLREVQWLEERGVFM